MQGLDHYLGGVAEWADEMSVTRSYALPEPRRAWPAPPPPRRVRLAACAAALLAAGALLVLPSAASAAVVRVAPAGSGGPGSAAVKQADTFLAVSCPTARMCIAVGRVTLNATDTMLAERWNGHQWSVTRVAHPPGATNSFLTAVSCTSARACTAVGSDYVPGTGGGPLAERWNGSRWAVEVTPSPGNAGVPFAAVSCGSATSCTAVGYDDFGAVGFTPDTLAERWNGRRWAIQPLPPAGNPGGALSAVSCRSRVACTAAGYYDGTSDEGPGTAPLAMRWDGSSWTVEPTAGDAGQNTTSGLTGVSCPTASTCTAVGESVYGGPLAMRWDGTKWRTQKVVGDFSLLGFNGVSCPSATACIAIGGTYGQRWNGRKWGFQHVGVPARAHGFNLTAVSCTSARACTAVGSRNMTASLVSDVRTVAERWNGHSWVLQATPSP
jgi:hypothetical protein